MADQPVTIVRGDGLATSVLKESAVEDFKASLNGALLRPGEAGYDDARKIWNGMIDKRPALIARCRGVADVINSVRFARAHDLLVAVRGGGHNIAGNGVCDGGLTIDLSPMKGVRVDPVRGIASAQSGMVWAELDCATQAFGLAVTGGQISTTVSRALRLAADGATLPAAMVSPPTTCSRSTWSRRPEISSPPARRRIRICSGACAAAAGISELPLHLSINFIRSARCSRASWRIPSPRHAKSSGGFAR